MVGSRSHCWPARLTGPAWLPLIPVTPVVLTTPVAAHAHSLLFASARVACRQPHPGAQQPAEEEADNRGCRKCLPAPQAIQEPATRWFSASRCRRGHGGHSGYRRCVTTGSQLLGGCGLGRFGSVHSGLARCVEWVVRSNCGLGSSRSCNRLALRRDRCGQVVVVCAHAPNIAAPSCVNPVSTTSVGCRIFTAQIPALHRSRSALGRSG